MNTTTKKPSQKVSKPIGRYRPGQVPKGVSVGSDNDSSDDSDNDDNVNEREVKNEDEFVNVVGVDNDIEEERKPNLKNIEISTNIKNLDVGDVDKDVKDVEIKKEEESSEEEEEPQRAPRLKPTFVPKLVS